LLLVQNLPHKPIVNASNAHVAADAPSAPELWLTEIVRALKAVLKLRVLYLILHS